MQCCHTRSWVKLARFCADQARTASERDVRSRAWRLAVQARPPLPAALATPQAFSKSEGISPISGGSPTFAASSRYHSCQLNREMDDCRRYAANQKAKYD